MQITKRIELDYGHTISGHYSVCSMLHGHRAKVEATVGGDIRPPEDISSHGMVVDFGIIKKIMMDRVHLVLDHGFAVWKDDEQDLNFIKNRNKKYLITPVPPTAEYLAEWAFNEIRDGLLEVKYALELKRVRWYETPNSWADYPN
jgi:6-pyruvoyltetrahydropterin/6-carboxytetrahydropterin synthase